MPKYSVDMTYSAMTTYSGVVEVEAADEAEAESKALAKVQKDGMAGWDSDEDAGDYDIQNVEEME